MVNTFIHNNTIIIIQYINTIVLNNTVPIIIIPNLNNLKTKHQNKHQIDVVCSVYHFSHEYSHGCVAMYGFQKKNK